MVEHTSPLSRLSPELLDHVLKATEAAKKELDKNWLTMMVATGVSLALTLGLDDLVPRLIVPDMKSAPEAQLLGTVVSLVLPFVQLYLFMRFGSLVYVFSQARSAAAVLTETFVKENGQERYFLRQAADGLHDGKVSQSVIFRTNSYFEPFYNPEAGWPVACYGLVVPVVMSLSHSTSLYLIWEVWSKISLVSATALAGIYGLVLVALYGSLFVYLRMVPFALRKINLSLIALIDVTSAMLTCAATWVFISSPPDLHIILRPRTDTAAATGQTAAVRTEHASAQAAAKPKL